MDFMKEYDRIMAEQSQIALATCAGSSPNVRVINFCCDNEKKGVVYFASFGNNQKVKEFRENSTVAFTTIPPVGNAHVRVRNATVQQSQYTIYDLQDNFINKISGYEATIRQAGKYLVLFEIHFNEADVTVDMRNRGKVILE